MKTIYLAGGCFWGLEKYLSLLPGVLSTQVGYANGRTANPSYEQVCRENTGHAETVKVDYDETLISLRFLLGQFYRVIDPASLNRQGNDIGTQYRTGIYFEDARDEATIARSLQELQATIRGQVVVEALPLEHFYTAEEYHQQYLDKNPEGYCHIGLQNFVQARRAVDVETRYRVRPQAELRESLTPLQFEVTQRAATERPHQNEYNGEFAQGIYVDITTGAPLFLSTDKFESGCGWPAFSKPISPEMLDTLPDHSFGRVRTEVRSKHGNAHLGHVFTDGPREAGGLRYCINSASLRFIPKDEMEAEGYGDLMGLLEKRNG